MDMHDVVDASVIVPGESMTTLLHLSCLITKVSHQDKRVRLDKRGCNKVHDTTIDPIMSTPPADVNGMVRDLGLVNDSRFIPQRSDTIISRARLIDVVYGIVRTSIIG